MAGRMRDGDVRPYKGRVVKTVYFLEGDSDLVHHWEYVIGGYRVDREHPEDHGLTTTDLDRLDGIVMATLERTEGWQSPEIYHPVN